jgi:hypothetical protein
VEMCRLDEYLHYPWCGYAMLCYAAAASWDVLESEPFLSAVDRLAGRKEWSNDTDPGFLDCGNLDFASSCCAPSALMQCISPAFTE